MMLHFHSDTAQLINALKNSETQAVLILGERGSGTLAAAQELAGNTLIDTLSPTDIKGVHDPEKGSIRIVQIRSIVERVKTSSSSVETIIIDNADTMGAPAQNAFLKLLEEPRPHLRFILTAHTISRLLPTIISRVQKISLHSITAQQSKSLLEMLGVSDPRTIQQMLYLADGLPAELTRLATNTSYFHSQSTLAGDSRVFLQGSIAQKTIIANKYHSNRSDALALLTATQRMLSHSLNQKPSRNIIDSLRVTSHTYEAIAAGGNVRLQLLTCVV